MTSTKKMLSNLISLKFIQKSQRNSSLVFGSKSYDTLQATTSYTSLGPDLRHSAVGETSSMPQIIRAETGNPNASSVGFD